MKKTLLVIGLIAILAAGCANNPNNGVASKSPAPASQGSATQNGPEKKAFDFGQEFKVSIGSAYTNAESGLSLAVVSFSDAACGQSPQCVWEGNRGVRLRAGDSNSSGEVFLGETTRKTADLLKYYSIGLVSVDTNSRSAIVVVAKKQGDSLWFYFEPKQCGTNPWENAAKDGNSNDEALVTAWLKNSAGIDVLAFAQEKVYDVVCAACDCPRGDRIAVLVSQSGSAKLGALGWKLFNGNGMAACQEDAKLCPNGSAVTRNAPFCGFPECASRDFYVRKTDVPGFVANPTFVTTIIDGNSAVIVETKDSNGHTTTSNSVASEGRVDALKALVQSSTFFSLGPNDMKICATDRPTVTLTIVSGGKSNTIYGIGAWCDPNKLQGIDRVLQKIDEISRNAAKAATGQ